AESSLPLTTTGSSLSGELGSETATAVGLGRTGAIWSIVAGGGGSDRVVALSEEMRLSSSLGSTPPTPVATAICASSICWDRGVPSTIKKVFFALVSNL
ncbi:MAG: hypothetical protein MUP13_06080, partial [Thermoanaerobaculales bacterium]|nr:hypothetical protein [Thermoanaerobaculales bacterium]